MQAEKLPPQRLWNKLTQHHDTRAAQVPGATRGAWSHLRCPYIYRLLTKMQSAFVILGPDSVFTHRSPLLAEIVRSLSLDALFSRPDASRKQGSLAVVDGGPVAFVGQTVAIATRQQRCCCSEGVSCTAEQVGEVPRRRSSPVFTRVCMYRDFFGETSMSVGTIRFVSFLSTSRFGGSRLDTAAG